MKYFLVIVALIALNSCAFLYPKNKKYSDSFPCVSLMQVIPFKDKIDGTTTVFTHKENGAWFQVVGEVLETHSAFVVFDPMWRKLMSFKLKNNTLHTEIFIGYDYSIAPEKLAKYLFLRLIKEENRKCVLPQDIIQDWSILNE